MITIQPEGSRGELLFNQMVLGIGACVFAILLLGWRRGWLIGVAIMFALIVTAALRDVPTLTLADSALEERKRKRQTRIPLRHVERVELERIPYRDSIIHISSKFEKISCRVRPETREFLYALGGSLAENDTKIHLDSAAQAALGMRRRPGTRP